MILNYVDRDIASAQELCNRGIETYRINARSKFGRQVLTYRGTPEKQEIGSQVERAGAEPSSAPFESSVVLSGNFVLDKWRIVGSNAQSRGWEAYTILEELV